MGGDTPTAQPSAQVVGVVALVGMRFAGPPTAGSTTGADGRNAAHERPQALAVVHVGAGDAQRQRKSVPVVDQVDFRSRLATVGRIRSRQRPPFAARTDALPHARESPYAVPVEAAEYQELEAWWWQLQRYGFQSRASSPSSTSSRNSPITQAEERSTPSRTKPLRSAERIIGVLSESVSIWSRCSPRTTNP